MEECGPCPVIASFTLAFALQLRKKHGETSVWVAEENVFCIYVRTNSDLCHLQHKLIGFYNRDEKCLQRGTDWVFK
jgi:hypothetical protein